MIENSRYQQYARANIEELLLELDRSAEAGSDTYKYLENMLNTRTAALIYNGLAENAGATRISANSIKDSIDALIRAIGESSAETRDATVQSAVLARRLNAFTLTVAIATVLMVFATGFQAWETKRQADVAFTQPTLAMKQVHH